MAEIKYPSAAKIIELNAMAVTFIHAKKADEAKVLSKNKLMRLLTPVSKKMGTCTTRRLSCSKDSSRNIRS